MSDAEIARRLRHTQGVIVSRRCKVLRRIGGGDILLTSQIARTMGVSGVCVANWIRRGWLIAHRGGVHQNQGGGWFYVRWQSLDAFIRDETHWGRWWIEDMPPSRWRHLAEHVRAGVELIDAQEAGRRLGYCSWWVHELIRRGALPGIRGSVRRPDGWHGSRTWYVRADQLGAIS